MLAAMRIESQCLGDLGITLISVTVDIGESLSVRVH